MFTRFISVLSSFERPVLGCVVFRLRSVQALLSTIDEVRSLVDDYERAVSSHNALGVDSTQLHVMRMQIQVSLSVFTLVALTLPLQSVFTLVALTLPLQSPLVWYLKREREGM